MVSKQHTGAFRSILRMRCTLLLIGFMVLAVALPAPAASAPEVTEPAPAPRMRDLTPQERAQIEAQMAEIRRAAIAQARRLLADPEFVAAVQRMATNSATGIAGQNEVAVPLQLSAGILYSYGTGKIREALFQKLGINFGYFPPRLKRFTPDEADDLNPAKTLAIGVAAIGTSAAMAYLSPPVEVEPGFRNMSFADRLQSVQAHAWQLPGAPLIERDVDDTADPTSCSATLGLSIDGGGFVTDFGEFSEEELAWVYPFGSYPGLAEVFPELVQLIANTLGSFPGLDVPEIVQEISISGEISAPVSIEDFISRLIHSNLSIEDFFYDSFAGWKLDHGRISCSGGACVAPDGPSQVGFRASVNTIPGILGYNFSYTQPILAKEYFPPVFTGLLDHLTVYYEALEPGGVPTSLPPVDLDGSPVPGHSQLLDPTWFGLEDNCDPNPVLEWTLPSFLELGIHELPVRAVDRSGNLAETTITVVVRDSLPPDILPPEDVGVTAPAGSSTLPFTAPGVGCVTWLCEGNPPQYKLYPALTFDFASLEPVIGCTVENSLYAAPEPCAAADLAVGESNQVHWTFTDPSGNSSTVDQLAVVRAEGTNRIPSAQGASYTIPNVPEGVTIQVPLTASDPDLDPLTFIVANLPSHGDLGLTATPVFQTRFASSGAIRRATSFVKLTSAGVPSDLLIVADGPAHKLLVFDIVDPQYLYLYDMVDLGDINPDAIQLPGAPRVVDGRSLSSVLSDLWIADFTDEGNGDTSVNAIYRGANTPVRMADLQTEIPQGAHGRDFRIDVLDLSGQNQQVDFTVNVTGEPALLSDSPPTFSPLNQRLGFRLTSNDSGASWIKTVTDSGTPENTTSTTRSNGTLGCNGVADAFWSTSPPWGELTGPHPLTPFLVDPDGDGPALPVLQDPTSFGLASCSGTAGTALVLESQNNWLEAFGFDSTPGSTPTRIQDFRYPLRLTRFINIRSIQEIPGGGGAPRFLVLDDTGVYRFDLAGRLSAFMSFQAGASNSLPPAAGSVWSDLATDPAGHVFLLSSSIQSEGALSFVIRFTVSDGVGHFSDNGRQPSFGNTNDRAWALAADGSNVFAAGEFGLYRCVNDLNSCTQLLASAPYRDIEIRTGTNELFMTELNGATQRVVRTDRNGTFIAAFGQGLLDFGPGASGTDLSGVMYGRMAYDAAADRLSVSDNPLSDPDDPSSPRIPRVRVFSGDGTLLETIVPDASPNIFSSWLQPGDFGSVSDLAVGPGRIYVAEVAPLKRLHVFDAATAYPVPCPDPTAECRAVDYDPDAGFSGPDSFSYAASDPFGGTSPPGVINLTVIDDTAGPIITCAADLTVEARNAGGLTLTDPLDHEPDAGLRAFFSPPVSDNVDLPAPVLSHDGGPAFPVGSTTVTFTATDGAGNTSTCTAVLTVADTTPPQFIGPDGPTNILPPVVAEAAGKLTPFSPPAPTVSDVSGVASVTHNGPASYLLGDTEIVWTATDLGGNTATAVQIVRVLDTTPPEFTTPLPPDDLYQQVAVSGWANPIQYDPQSATDSVDVVSIDCDPAIGDPVPTGVITVDCLAMDLAGNLGRRTFFVDVEDQDRDGDGIGNLADPAPTVVSTGFSDLVRGGRTNGRIAGGEHRLLVTDGPTAESGVSVVVAGRSGPQPTEVVACADRLHAWLAFTTFEPEPGVLQEANDSVVLTCLSSGSELSSELGTIEAAFQLPAGGAAEAVLDSGETARLVGWMFTVPATSAGEVQVSAGGTTVTVAPGETRSLVELIMGPSADLALSGGSSPEEATIGQPLTVFFDIANAGPSDALKPTLQIAVPPGLVDVVADGCEPKPGGLLSCTVEVVRVGEVARVSITGTVTRAAGSILSVPGAVGSDMFDPDTGNNAATVQVPVTSAGLPPRVSAGFSPDVVPFLEGSSTLTITLENPGAEAPALSAVGVAGTLPAGLVVATPANLGTTCDGAAGAASGSGAVTVSGATLAPGGSCSVWVDVAVDPDVAGVGDLAVGVASSADAAEAGSATEAVLKVTPVTSFAGPTATGTGAATVAFTGGGETCTFARAAWLAEADMPPAARVTFPHGLVGFNLTGCTPGAAIELTLTEPSALGSRAAYWRWGATGGVPTPHWEELPAAAGGSQVVVTVADGGPGDDDLAPNGRIAHTGGPAVPAAQEIPVLGSEGLSLLVLLIAALGALLLVRKP